MSWIQDLHLTYYLLFVLYVQYKVQLLTIDNIVYPVTSSLNSLFPCPSPPVRFSSKGVFHPTTSICSNFSSKLVYYFPIGFLVDHLNSSSIPCPSWLTGDRPHPEYRKSLSFLRCHRPRLTCSSFSLSITPLF